MNNAVIKWRTQRETVRFTLEWTIENISSFRYDKGDMYGPGITMAELGMKNDSEGRWFIIVAPCFKQTSNGKENSFVSVFLKLLGNTFDVENKPGTDSKPAIESDRDNSSGKKSDTETKSDMYKESVQRVNGKKLPVEFNARITTGKTSQEIIWRGEDDTVQIFTAGDLWGWSEAISHDKLFGLDKKPGLLKDDCITVSMNVVVYNKQCQSIRISKSVAIDLSTPRACRNFGTRQLDWFSAQQQLPSRDLDFVLQSNDGKEFHTSRWILMAHSPVFAAMLKQDTQEAKTSRCEMADVDGETTEIMLNYMFGCSMQNVNEGNAEKVLIMADKYQMMDLLHACEELLAGSVPVKKAVHLLILASQRGLEKLKLAALDVIPKNMTTVLKDGALEEAMQADPYLMQTIMEHCSKRMRIIEKP